MLLQQWFTLVEVGDVGTGEDKSQRITKPIAGHVYFGREAGPGASHRLGDLTAGRARSVLMNTTTGAVDHQVIVITLTADCRQHGIAQAAGGPPPKRGVDRFPRSKNRRKIPPRHRGPKHPEDRLEAKTLICTLAATKTRAAQIAPMAVNFLSSSQSPSAKTNLIDWFTMRC